MRHNPTVCFITRDDGARLCQDGKWRKFAMLGSTSACLKFYKRRSAARARAMLLAEMCRTEQFTVHHLPHGWELDASGCVTPPEHGRQSYVQTTYYEDRGLILSKTKESNK